MKSTKNTKKEIPFQPEPEYNEWNRINCLKQVPSIKKTEEKKKTIQIPEIYY